MSTLDLDALEKRWKQVGGLRDYGDVYALIAEVRQLQDGVAEWKRTAQQQRRAVLHLCDTYDVPGLHSGGPQLVELIGRLRIAVGGAS